ncbi:unnamed protein product [Polarella glacialis]|uniref:Ion transport domain-containing protein n=1 Tax=Polarella glacialis TaxID=89957 RepID=A0A813G2G5_POLGL|nr:unnamed protein product [Polarella glacialis]
MFNVSMRLRILLMVFQRAINPTLYFSLLFMVFHYCSALAGLQLYYITDSLENTVGLGFDNFPNAFFTVMAVFAGDGWFAIFVEQLRNKDNIFLGIVFYIFCFVLGRLILRNLLLGIVAAEFAIARDSLKQHFRLRLVLAHRRKILETNRRIEQIKAMMVFQEDETEPESPKWPPDAVRPIKPYPGMTRARNMDVLKMIQKKCAAGSRRTEAGKIHNFIHTSYPWPGISLQEPSIALSQDAKTLQKIEPERMQIDTQAAATPTHTLLPDAKHMSPPPCTDVIVDMQSCNLSALEDVRGRALQSSRRLCPELHEQALQPPLCPLQRTQQGDFSLGSRRPQVLELRLESLLVGRSREEQRSLDTRSSSFSTGFEDVVHDGGSGSLRRRAVCAHGLQMSEPTCTGFRERFQRARRSAFFEASRQEQPSPPVSRKDREAPARSAFRRVHSSQHMAAPMEASHPLEPTDEELNASGAGDSKDLRGLGLGLSVGTSRDEAEVFAVAAALVDVMQADARAEAADARAEAAAARAAAMAAPAAAATVRVPHPEDYADSFPQKLAIRIVLSRFFEPAIMVSIILSSISSAFQNPYQDDNAMGRMICDVIDQISVLVVLLEMMVRIMAMGLRRSPKYCEPGQFPGYFRVGWHKIDFVIVVTGILYAAASMMSLGRLVELKTMRTLKIVGIFATRSPPGQEQWSPSCSGVTD